MKRSKLSAMDTCGIGVAKTLVGYVSIGAAKTPVGSVSAGVHTNQIEKVNRA